MCASYGLDSHFADPDLFSAADAETLAELRAWAAAHEGETLRPTGINARNLNPLLVPKGADASRITPAWWGFLVGGKPAKFPSINTRVERLIDRPGDAVRRAIVPATSWFEHQKPAKVWHRYDLGEGRLFGLGAVARLGKTLDGIDYICYSIVMRDATPETTEIHDRMPLLIAPEVSDDWLHAESSRALIEHSLEASHAVANEVRTEALKSRP